MKTTETIACQECSSTFEWEDKYKNDSSFRGMFKPDHCEKCAPIIEARQAEIQRRHQEEKRHERIDGFMDAIRAKVPPLFQKTNVAHPRFNTSAWSRIKDIRPTDEKPWLGFVGETGTSKTRIAYLIALEIIREMAEPRFNTEAFLDRPPSVMFVSSYQITEAVMAQFSGTKESQSDARSWLDSLRAAHFLMIDDLGKGKLSPAVAAEMFAIVDHRYQHEMAMIWTANSTPEQIAANLSEDMAAPFAGRLNDSSRILRFK
jgi:DNA replication protein DnaC